LEIKQSKNDMKMKEKAKQEDKILKHFGLDKLPNNLIPEALKENDQSIKQPTKTLEGHKKAVREIAYSPATKTLISCGFDFEIFVWNPYISGPTITLKGHDNPLVGVNCLPDESGDVKNKD
jgi:WD40 repeat protein